MAKSKPQTSVMIPPRARLVSEVLKIKPDWCFLIPGTPQEMGKKGGFRFTQSSLKNIKRQIDRMHFIGIEVSLLIDANQKDLISSYNLGADAVSFVSKKISANLEKKLIQLHLKKFVLKNDRS